jgi:hypothetical protein
MAQLETTSDVIKALGGRGAVAELFGVGATAVDHWENGKFPAHTYLDMVAELAKRGHEAPPSLWKFRRTWSSREREGKTNENAA